MWEGFALGVLMAFVGCGAFFLGFHLCYRHRVWVERARIYTEDDERRANRGPSAGHPDLVKMMMDAQRREEDSSPIGPPPPMPEDVAKDRKRMGVP